MKIRDKKNMFVLCSILLILFIGLTIGYAFFSSTLNFVGTAAVAPNDWKIIFKNLKVASINKYTNEISSDISDNGSTLNFDVEMTAPGAGIVYTVDIINEGRYNAEISNIIVNVPKSNNAFTFEYYYSDTYGGVSKGDILNSGESKQITICMEISEASLEVNLEELSISFSIEFFTTEDEDVPVDPGDTTVDYATDGLILDLRGTTEIGSNTWIDGTGNNNLSLTNVTYNSNLKSYSFKESGAFATANKPLIPLTGDFTLETYVILPDVVNGSNIDQAIVSQVNDNSNDAGRFKFNLYQGLLRMFYNEQYPASSNLMYPFINGVSINSKQLIQVVRSGETLSLYYNGILVKSYDYLATNVISSGSFKLGRWNNATVQQFLGSYHAVRLYDRALSGTELKNNALMDHLTYDIIDDNYTSLFDYAVKRQLDDSLFLDSTGSSYVYRGMNPNNYIKFGESDHLFRIIGYEENGMMKLVDVSYKDNVAFDETNNRTFETSTYCNKSSTIVSGVDTFGCNAWASALEFTNTKTTGSVNSNSSINEYVNNVYYNSLSKITRDRIVNHEFYVGVGISGLTRDEVISKSKEYIWNGKIGLITLADAFNANIDGSIICNSNTKFTNYITSLSNTNEYIWTMTPDSLNTYDVFTLIGNSIGSRRPTRTNQVNGSTTSLFYAMPTFYTTGIVDFTGDGSEINPFLIN